MSWLYGLIAIEKAKTSGLRLYPCVLALSRIYQFTGKFFTAYEVRKNYANIHFHNRAKFSEITRQSVKRAVDNLDQPNQMVSNAVDVRSELDLRIGKNYNTFVLNRSAILTFILNVGASFTRFQTLRLQKVFPDVLGSNLISYGSCQFPTLGFVVERYKAVQNFIPEKFWRIKGK